MFLAALKHASALPVLLILSGQEKRVLQGRLQLRSGLQETPLAPQESRQHPPNREQLNQYACALLENAALLIMHLQNLLQFCFPAQCCC